MTREEKEQTGKYVLQMARLLEDGCYQQEMLLKAVHIIDEALEQEPKIKVLDRDEAMRKLGAVDIYQASAWVTLLNDLEYLKLKICEVEE